MTRSPHIQRFLSVLSPRAATLGGAALGLLMGWYGLVFGIVLGAIVDALRWQRGSDQALIDWLENPGTRRIDEPVPGLVAFCALAVLLLVENVPSGRRRSSAGIEDSGIVWKVGLLASTVAVSLQEQRPLLENMARVAFVYRDNLNPDLLAEVLAARRRHRDDLHRWLSLLEALCDSEAARSLFNRIMAEADPSCSRSGKAGKRGDAGSGALPEADAWSIIGLAPGSSRGELVRVYRRLARQFHPDALHGLDEDHLRQAANAFLRIDAAYRCLRDTVFGRRVRRPS